VPSTPAPRPRIVIVGAGFGGLAAARALAGADADITLVDKRNHHLFQPLLYQVATAGLSPADIAAPVRSILKDQYNTRVVLDAVTGVDPVAQSVRLASGGTLAFDWLILATGARHSYFGRDEWAAFAPGIKTIDDATAVRRKVLLALERAETERDKARRDALLTFTVIGGGPTGVEMAGAIAELARKSVSKDFRSITPHCSRIVLIDGGPRLLAAFPPGLAERAQTSLEALGVEVRLGARVDHVCADFVGAGGERIACATAIWAAGVEASPAASWLGVDADPAGRVRVGPDLRVPGHDRIFVIGDTAAFEAQNGRMLPGVAPVAKQQGHHAARTIVRLMAGAPAHPFAYRDYGNLATIGRNHAVADFGRFRVSGILAWLLWCVAHIWFLAGFRNRLVVGLNWLWHYLTFDRAARLITGDPEFAHPPTPATPSFRKA
jgi:NADH:ubiquinone reductase (H+-translocating)